MDLDSEFQRLYQESPVEIQRQFNALQEMKTKVREWTDIISSVVVNTGLPLEILELMAELLKRDCKRIRQTVEEGMMKGQEVTDERAKKDTC